MIKAKSFKYADGCSIELRSNSQILIKFQNEICHFDDKAKSLFDYGTGERVIEYSGLAVDGNEKRSWAKAYYTPKAYAPLHYHNNLTEDYYIIQGRAIVMIDGNQYPASVSEHIQIKPGQQHQVLNASDDEELVLIVKCTPSWTKNDYNLVNNEELEKDGFQL